MEATSATRKASKFNLRVIDFFFFFFFFPVDSEKRSHSLPDMKEEQIINSAFPESGQFFLNQGAVN